MKELVEESIDDPRPAAWTSAPSASCCTRPGRPSAASAPRSPTREVDELYERARSAGAIGGKLTGAGGGGFLLLFVAARPAARPSWTRSTADSRAVRVRVGGSQIIFYEPGVDYRRGGAGARQQAGRRVQGTAPRRRGRIGGAHEPDTPASTWRAATTLHRRGPDRDAPAAQRASRNVVGAPPDEPDLTDRRRSRTFFARGPARVRLPRRRQVRRHPAEPDAYPADLMLRQPARRRHVIDAAHRTWGVETALPGQLVQLSQACAAADARSNR